MGKRKTRTSQQKRQSLETSSSSTELHESSELTFSNIPEDNSYLIAEVHDCLTDIYREYLRDLKTRKQKRRELKNPTSETQLYNLVINPSYRSSLKLKVRSLLHLDCTCTMRQFLPEAIKNDPVMKSQTAHGQKFCHGFFQNGILKSIVDEVLEDFLSALKEFLREAEDKSRLLQLVYFHEVYHTMQNSIGELSRILVDLYTYEEFNKISLTKYYSTVLITNRKLLNYAKTQDSTHFAVVSVIKMYEDIELLIKTGKCQQKDLLLEISSDLDEVSEEPVHSLPLEDLVNYINGPSTEVKHKNKMKKQVEFLALDNEVSEFETRLATTKPLTVKNTPFCSVDFLKSLKDQYLEVRRKLLNN
ncbi:hypothetical protein SteCoe_20615 [Stentor coeruleus]|uniref:Uncharacterized protein n=1 Tax=Stentor coeruleus TaxID=5963 RepID=A0A1R2BRJ3_9CILI|nr:hypothetical protein SteCoe_20615 [Stentor coeruleus]